MEKENTTITDLAKALKLNISTVSRALKNNPRISAETRQRVQQMAQKLNYEPNHFASSLRMGKSRSIGIVVPRINRFFFSNVIGGIETIANQNGFNTVICQTHESFRKETDCIRELLKFRVDGIIISLSVDTKSYSHLRQVQQKGIPLIMFDRIGEDLDVNKVVIDDYDGAFQAVEHLIQQGCRKIAHLGGPQHLNVYKNRFNGYADALKKHNIAINEKWIDFNALTRETGIEASKKIFGITGRPDAVFASSDFSAMGALEYTKQIKLKVPGDVAIVGFANEPFTDFLNLSTIDQQPVDMGKQIAQLFLNEIENPETATSGKIVLKPKLIIRGSSERLSQTVQ